MIRSMTGYGRADQTAQGWRCTVELRSVNGRHLDVRLRLPPGLTSLQEPLRRVVRGHLERGNVEGTVTLGPAEEGAGGLRLDQGLLREYAGVLGQAEAALERPIAVSLGDLLNIRDLVGGAGWEEQPEAVEALAGEATAAACQALVAMRETEGDALKQTLLEQVATLRELTGRTAERTAELPALAAAQLRERLARLSEGSLPNEDRVHQEIAILADRSDVSEELDRIGSHLDHLTQLLEAGGAVGRKLDFLLQELNREVNTLSVKSSDAPVSEVVIEIKSVIEKVREQVQNIE